MELALMWKEVSNATARLALLKQMMVKLAKILTNVLMRLTALMVDATMFLEDSTATVCLDSKKVMTRIA
jgi:hypothetical protein